MVAVVVDHGDAGGLAPFLETAVNAAERRQSGADFLHRNIDFEAHQHCRHRVANRVQADAADLEFT